jgi:hypothetical protein
MIDLSTLQADVASAVSDLPSQVIYGGQTIAVLLSPVNASDDVDEIGVLQESDLEAVSVATDFNPAPKMRDIVQVKETPTGDPVRYFVERTTRDETALHLFLKRA